MSRSCLGGLRGVDGWHASAVTALRMRHGLGAADNSACRETRCEGLEGWLTVGGMGGKRALALGQYGGYAGVSEH